MMRSEVRPELTKIIPFVAQMVVNHVKHYSEAGAVSGIYQPPQSFWPAVARLNRVRRDAVVCPVAVARKSCHRHDFDGGHAKLLQVFEALDRSVESSCGRECSDVQFIKNRIAQLDPT